MPNDLRHESESSDLQSTCRALAAQKLENEKLRADYDDLKRKMESCESAAQSHDFDTRRMRSEIENLKTELESMQRRATESPVIEKISQTDGSGDCELKQKLEEYTVELVRISTSNAIMLALTIIYLDRKRPRSESQSSRKISKNPKRSVAIRRVGFRRRRS